VRGVYELVLDDRAAADLVAPVPDPGAAGPVLLADDWHVVLAYNAAVGQADPRWTSVDGADVAVCVFDFVAGLYFGGPNERLPGSSWKFGDDLAGLTVTP
jgi:hypothetical protein